MSNISRDHRDGGGIAVVDASVTGYEELVKGAEAQGLEVVCIKGSEDGFTSLAEQLAGRTDIDSIHIFSHGDEGEILLGNETLSSENVQDFADELQVLSGSLSEDADILLYGCNVGNGEKGKAFVRQLADMTGADVAASDDITGNADRGGDWDLEIKAGDIESAVDVAAFVDFSESLGTQHKLGLNEEFTFTDTGHQTLTDGEFTVTASHEIKQYSGNSGSNYDSYMNIKADYGPATGWVKFDSDAPFFLDSIKLGEGYNYQWSHVRIVGHLQSGGEIPVNVEDGGPDDSWSVNMSKFEGKALDYFKVDIGAEKALYGFLIYSFETSAAPTNNAPVFPALASIDPISKTTAETNPVIIDMDATDGDGGDADDNVTYTIKSGNDGSIFTIDSDDGEIRFANPSTLNFKTESSYTLTIQANDGESSNNTATQDVTINLKDCVGPAVSSVSVPEAKSYKAGDTLDFVVNFDETVTVTGEGSTLGLTIGETSVNAVYQAKTDSNITYRYTIKSGNLDTDGITIGDITLNSDTIQDAAGNPADLTLNSVGDTTSVLVDGVPPDAPSEDNMNRLQVAENSANDTKVGVVLSDGADSFSLKNDADGCFAIDNDGNVTVADGSKLDFETKDSHIIVVEAKDAAGNTREAPLTVTLSDAPEAPVIISDPVKGTTPNTPYVFTIDDFNFSDVDAGDKLIYVRVESITKGELTLSGEALSADAEVFMNDIKAGNLKLTPDGNGDQSFTYKVSDGFNWSEDSATMTVTVNNTPVLSGLGGDTAPTFTEKGSAVVLDADVTASDTELDALASGSGNYGGATLTISRHGGANTNDQFTCTANASIVDVTNTDGELTLAFKDGATTAQVNAAIQSITYANTSDVPSKNVQLDYVFSDGVSAATGTVTVTVDAVNDAPVFANLDATPSFTEDGSAVILDADATIFDAELDASCYDGATLTIEREGGANAEDVFGPSGTLGALPEGEALTVSGTTIGTVTTNSEGTLQLSFNGAATTELLNSILQQITYTNTSDAPSDTVVLKYMFSDGNLDGAQGEGGAKTVSGSVTVSLTAINDAPKIENVDGDTIADYKPSDGAVLINQDADAVVVDPDSTDFNGGTLTVSVAAGGIAEEDVLGIKSVGTEAGQIALSGEEIQFADKTIGTVSGGTGGNNLVITLTDDATLDAVAALVDSITYENVAVSPTKEDREVQFVLTDGDGDGGTSEISSATVEFYTKPSTGGSTTDPDGIPSKDVWDYLPDDDGDGIPEMVEDFVPGLEGGKKGDGNGDGIADSSQQNVTSVPFRNTDRISENPDADATFVSLAANVDESAPAGGTVVSVRNVAQQDAPEDAPAGAKMPLGLIDFEATISTPGASESFSLFVDDELLINGYWKQNAAGDWVNLASEEYGGAIVTQNGKTCLDFTITDGGEFDNDGKADGVITDPGAVGYLSGETVFDEVYYLNSKLDQLAEIGDTRFQTTDALVDIMAHYGMNPYEHYCRYGLEENTDPSAYFNTSEYLRAKTDQLNRVAENGKTDWTVEDTVAAFRAAGFDNALDHFAQFGWCEDVNPSNEFDVSEYFVTKAAQVGMTVDEVKGVFDSLGDMNPLNHYKMWGQNEDGVYITRVSGDECVSDEPVCIELQGVAASDASVYGVGE